MTKAKKNQSKSKGGNDQTTQVTSAAEEEFALLVSLLQPYSSQEDLRDALTRSCAPNELFTLLFVNRKNESSIHLGLTWAVSEEIQILSSKTVFFLCDVDDTDFINPVVGFMMNLLDFNDDFVSHCTNGVPNTPSAIVFAPTTRKLVYAEYQCKITSLPTIIMVIEDHQQSDLVTSEGNGRPSTWHQILDSESTSREESGSEFFSDREEHSAFILPPGFEVFRDSVSRNTLNPPDMLNSLRRVQERHEIQEEYQQALAADRMADQVAEEKRVRDLEENEKLAQKEKKRQEVERQKDRIRSKLFANQSTADTVTICLRQRTGEKVVFHIAREENLLSVIEMAYATDPMPMNLSHVRIRSLSPSVVYHSLIENMPSVGDLARGSSTFTFMTEISSPE